MTNQKTAGIIAIVDTKASTACAFVNRFSEVLDLSGVIIVFACNKLLERLLPAC